jgi:hypothetical protein
LDHRERTAEAEPAHPEPEVRHYPGWLKILIWSGFVALSLALWSGLMTGGRLLMHWVAGTTG